ncbi:ABC transporter ATP-binding protein [Acidiphilium sp.]|jgi:multiple sugar transport system ATP-binding protein|uniref:ABC transporter ATP-binding protein n=1 Tax=Acidiphilium sp. TaxID=527 RepID=UPI002589D9EE|nr:ABC transporter ATP-binding protein [Acidiphilium sp.]
MSLLLTRLSKSYGHGASAVHAVRALDLEVAEGEIVALLGSSGCGKTSTLRMIAGFETVTEGSITLAGRRIDHLAPASRGVAMAFEGYALYPPLSIAENIGFGLARGRSRADATRLVREIAALLDIEDILDRRPGGLSGGQQQRASLARALARHADLHLLDEPMGQLEPQLRAVLRGRVKALIKQRGYTAVLVTHDQTEANAMADRIAVMEGGELQQYGTPETLRARPANLFVATFLGEPPMNVLAAEPDGDGARLGGAAGVTVALPLGALLLGEMPAGGVALGIRPHRLRLGEGPLSGTIASNQWLGDQAHVVIDFAGRLLVAVSDRRVPARMGETIAFGFAPRDVHLFDCATGAALRHGLAAP